MPCFSEICPLRGTLLKPHKFNFDAPTRPIFSNASPVRASLDFLFQTFLMEQIRRTRGDYSLAVQHAATPGATIVLRSFREPQYATETNHAAEDRAMLWGVVDVRQASAL